MSEAQDPRRIRSQKGTGIHLHGILETSEKKFNYSETIFWLYIPVLFILFCFDFFKQNSV